MPGNFTGSMRNLKRFEDGAYRFDKPQLYTLERPIVEVEIITEKKDLVVRGEITGDIDTSEMASDCLNVITKRDIGNDCPTFSVTLIYRDEWFYEMGANNLVIIRMGRKSQEIKPVMFGLIDDIRKSVLFGNGKPRRTIVVSGRGFGKGLVTFEVGAVNEINIPINEVAGWIGDSSFNISQASAAKAIGMLYEKYIKIYVDYYFGTDSNGMNLTYCNLMRYSGTEREKEELPDTSFIIDYQGSLWNLFKELQNAPFNEMFWEIENDLPTLIVRPTPFNSTDWTSLNTVNILSEDIISDNTGRSDIETYTLYSVTCQAYNNILPETTLGCLPLWYPLYYEKYGIKRLSVSSIYSAYMDTKDKEKTEENINANTIDLFNWNIKNNSMFNGTLDVKGDPKYKVGCKLKHKSEDLEYYIESVSHNFSIYGSYTTQLSVTRGLKGGDKARFSEPFGKWEILTSMADIIDLRKGRTGDIGKYYPPEIY